MRREGAEGLQGRRWGQVGRHLWKRWRREVWGMLVRLRGLHLWDGGGGWRFNVGHGHGCWGQWLLSRGLATAL